MHYQKVIRMGGVGALALIFLAAGCTVGPDYKNPDLPTPRTWNEAQQSGIDATGTDLARWWTSFNDPLLDSLVERAVRSNLDLRLAEARIREARANRAVVAAGESAGVFVFDGPVPAGELPLHFPMANVGFEPTQLTPVCAGVYDPVKAK